MSTKVHVTINKKTGIVEYEVDGAIGTKCTELTNALAANNEVLEERLTEAYYEAQELPAYTDDL